MTYPSDGGSDPVEVEILFTAGCPNVGELHSYLAAQPGVRLTATEVGESEPLPPTFSGSPTVLIEGANPFGGRPVAAAACALIPPTVAEVAAELERRRPA